MAERRSATAALSAAVVAVATLAGLPQSSASAASAATNGTVRVSAYADGTQVTGDSFAEDLSFDGRHVLYRIHAQLWTLDRTTGARVRHDDGGTAPNSDITWQAEMTLDGRFLAFTTNRRLLPVDTNTLSDVYVRDRDTDVDGVFDEPEASSLELASVGPAGEVGNGTSSYPQISDDGSIVTFQGGSTNWGTAAGSPVYVRNRTAGTTSKITQGSLQGEHGLSGNGRYVVWTNYPRSEDVTWGHNEREMLLLDRTTGVKTAMGRTPTGAFAYPFDVTISGDARYLGFTSYESGLVAGDTNNKRDVFVIDRNSGEWDIVNRRPDGAVGSGETTRAGFSTDSGFVTFVATDGSMLAGDTNGHEDAFVRSLGADPITARVAQGLDNAQPDNYVATPSAVSDGAQHVLFTAGASNLVSGDTNNRPDAFLRAGLNLTPPPPTTKHSVSVALSGDGTGSVASTPAGIACPPTCRADFEEGTNVTLTASPGAGSQFGGFSGDCTGTGACALLVDRNRSVGAAFAKAPPAQPPVAVDDRYEATAGTPLVVDAPGVLANDGDPERGSLHASVTAEPTHGTLDLGTNGSFTYTPAAEFTGPDQFTYRATDPQGLDDSAVVTITVAAPPPSDLIVWSRASGGLYVGGPGKSPRQVLPGAAWSPSWNPDRTKIVFSSDRDGQWDLWTVNTDGSGLVKLTDNAAAESDPAWSPDGSRIAFAMQSDSDYEIFSIQANGSELRQLTSNPFYDTDPSWSPDGRRLVHQSNYDLQIIDADGANPTALVTAGPTWESGPSWSPDGSRVAYASQPFTGGGAPTVRLIDTDGTNDVLVPTQPWAHSPTWAPSGTHLAYVVNTSGNDEVWSAAIDGTRSVNVSEMPGTDIDPDWGEVAFAPPPAADLRVSASTGTDEVVSGSNFTVSGVATNAGPGSAAGAVLELEVSGASIVGVSPASCTVATATTASCALGALAAGEGVDYELTLNAGEPGQVRVTARLSCGCDQPPVSASASRTVVAKPLPRSLAVTVDGPVSALQGDLLTYRFTVVNGLTTSAAAVGLFMNARSNGAVLPISGTTTTHGSCSLPHSCQLGTLAAGASATVTIKVSVTVGQDFIVRGGVSCSCSDPDSTDNLAAIGVVVTPRPDLTFTIANPAKVNGGSAITWDVTVRGVEQAIVRNVVVEFDIPTGVVVDRVVSGVGGSSPASCQVLGQLVRCTYGEATGSPRLYIVGTPSRGGSYSITARVTNCDCVDPDTGNDTVTSAPCTAPAIADLSLTKRAGQTLARVGDIVTWTIAVTNAGPDAAPGVTVTDPLPKGFTFVAATANQGSCVLKGTTVACSLGTVAVGDPALVTLRARATAPHAGAVNTAQIFRCDCWEPDGTVDNKGSGAPIEVEPLVRPVIVTGCTSFTTLGFCHLNVFVHNDNPVSIPGGVVEISPIDSTGPRLDPDYVYPSWYRCERVGAVVRCTINGVIPSGGKDGLIVPLIPTSSSPFTLTATWNCGCVSYGAMVTQIATRTPTPQCIGGQVLFESNATKDKDIYAARLDGSGSTNITNNHGIDESGAVWSPDSSRFVFDRGPAGKRKLWVAVLNSEGCIESQYRVAGQPSSDNYQPEWSATGERIAFVSKVTGNHDIWVIRTKGGGLQQITRSSADDRAPSFSQSGTRIAFASRRNATGVSEWNIWTAAADGSGAERHLSTAATGYVPTSADYSPSFARGPGSSKILWHTNSGGNWDLWLMNEDGSNKRRLPGATRDAEKNADWSRDGTKIVYDAGTGSSGVWIMDSDGSDRRLVDETGAIDQAPSLHTTDLPPMPCGVTANSGGAGISTKVHELGQKQGTFRLSWQTFGIEDRIEVFYEGERIFVTEEEPPDPADPAVLADEYVAGPGFHDIQYGPGTDTAVTVVVTGAHKVTIDEVTKIERIIWYGTDWNYLVDCPA